MGRRFCLAKIDGPFYAFVEPRSLRSDATRQARLCSIASGTAQHSCIFFGGRSCWILMEAVYIFNSCFDFCNKKKKNSRSRCQNAPQGRFYSRKHVWRVAESRGKERSGPVCLCFFFTICFFSVIRKKKKKGERIDRRFLGSKRLQFSVPVIFLTWNYSVKAVVYSFILLQWAFKAYNFDVTIYFYDQ